MSNPPLDLAALAALAAELADLMEEWRQLWRERREEYRPDPLPPRKLVRRSQWVGRRQWNPASRQR